MDVAKYLDRLLLKYSGTFDIYRPYQIHGKEYPAYGYFFSHLEKYVLAKEANLWSADSYEHVLFIEADRIEEEHLKQADRIIRGYMEPELVRKGEKYPAENHMYSYLTVILLSQQRIERRVARKIRRYSYDRGYKFNMRGFASGRIEAVSMEDEKIYVNGAARKQKKPLKTIFEDIRNGKPGFEEICRKQNVEPFRQSLQAAE